MFPAALSFAEAERRVQPALPIEAKKHPGSERRCRGLIQRESSFFGKAVFKGVKVKFLFITAINAAKPIEANYPPLGLGYLASSLRARLGADNVDFKIICDNVEDAIADFKPDIVGISSVTQNYNRALSYAQTAKSSGLPVICGGVHITMMPRSLSRNIDAGVIGEGEDTICELAESFIKYGAFQREALEKIKGVIYWSKDGRIIHTPQRDWISDLGSLPLPARDLLTIKDNTYIFSSRGCPYRCTFCASSRFWNRVRLFPAGYVVNEIRLLIEEYKVKEIHFYDDLFCCDLNRIKEIIRLLKERGILGRVDFSGAIRANLVNDEMISLLKEMGIKKLGMGLESGSEETLKYLKGTNINLEGNARAIEIIRSRGIDVHCSFIIGSPFEMKKDILETLHFIKKSNLSGFDVYVLTAFPGTPVWEYAKAKGLVSEDMDWSRLNVDFEENHCRAVILSENLSRRQIYGFFLKFKRYRRQKELWGLIKKAFRNPFRALRFMIKKMRGRFES